MEECGAKAWTAADIAQYVENYIAAFGVVPVIIVDYLQILAAPEGKGSLTDKQAVDESLRVLKSLSASKELPVILISSLNRESYDQPVSLRSYKDTGSIEYSCDTVLAEIRGCRDPHPLSVLSRLQLLRGTSACAEQKTAQGIQKANTG